MKLTETQKTVIRQASKDTDWCCRGLSVTMRSLVYKGLAKYSSGFGWKYGQIIELTDSGKEVLERIRFK